MLLNNAYSTLKNPLLRAQYLIAQHLDISSESETLEDEEFMVEVMEAREEIEFVQSHEALEGIIEANQSRSSVLG
jgi:molecular chaperone HscB